MDKDKFIPSMFHRRLVLLLAVCVLITIIMTGQMFRLAVVEGASHLATAEGKLEQRTFLPTIRGKILDRQGRVLAVDRASCDLAVAYDVITGTWPHTQAASQARKVVGRSRWGSMSREQRNRATKERLPAWQEKTNQLWSEICRLGKLIPEELQDRLNSIKADVQATAAIVWEQQREDERSKFGVAFDEDYEFKARPIREQLKAHVILPRVADEITFSRLVQQFPGMIELQNSRKREYPWTNAEVPLIRASLPCPIRSATPMNIRVSGVADHILGDMRDEVWADDVKRRPFKNPQTGQIDLGWYVTGDGVGARGLEKVFEDSLRGTRGELRERKDTNEQTRIDAQPGRDLQLTIDIALQARVQAILSPEYGLTRVQAWQNNTSMPLGMPLNAVAVVMEVESGEILAMVSMPTFAMGEMMDDDQQLVNQPLVNRCVEAVYPPGSIIKPLVLAAAVTEGVQNIDHAITCKGHYFEDNESVARCWIFRPKYGMANHGALRADEALARSCNMFFYTLGDHLGIDRQIKWFRRFGLGDVLNVGLLSINTTEDGRIVRTGESDGSLPTEKDITRLRRDGQLKFSEVIMGIGQGPIAWTPVQAANAYSTIARGGVIRDATLLMNDPRGPRPQRCDDLHLNSKLVSTTLEGLRQSVMEHHGTGNHIGYEGGTEEPIINAEGVQVWAKTGTAQAPPLRHDSNHDGKLDKKDESIDHLDHSWFVGMVGPKDSNKPMHAIAVIVEYGGSGGRTAGPIANQIFRALQSEGYLPGDPNAPVPQCKAAAASQPEPEHEGDH